jgi:hypothetical protein
MGTQSAATCSGPHHGGGAGAPPTKGTMMFGKTIRRAVAVAATAVAVGGAAALAAVPAEASTPLCKDGDVRVGASATPDAPSGHRAMTLYYTAADAGVDCTLSGAPYGVTFYDRSGAPLDVRSTVAKGETPRQVTIDETHTATSFVLLSSIPDPSAVPATALRFHLPSDASSVPVGVSWPGTDVSGTPQVTDIYQN